MEIRVPNTEENIRIKRTGKKFQFKQVVTDLLINVVCDSIVAAKSYIEKTKYTTFCFGELQMHSIIKKGRERESFWTCRLLLPMQCGQTK